MNQPEKKTKFLNWWFASESWREKALSIFRNEVDDGALVPDPESLGDQWPSGLEPAWALNEPRGSPVRVFIKYDNTLYTFEAGRRGGDFDGTFMSAAVDLDQGAIARIDSHKIYAGDTEYWLMQCGTGERRMLKLQPKVSDEEDEWRKPCAP